MQRPFGKSTTMSTHLRPCTAVIAALPVSPDVPVSNEDKFYFTGVISDLQVQGLYKKM